MRMSDYRQNCSRALREVIDWHNHNAWKHKNDRFQTEMREVIAWARHTNGHEKFRTRVNTICSEGACAVFIQKKRAATEEGWVYGRITQATTAMPTGFRTTLTIIAVDMSEYIRRAKRMAYSKESID